MITSSVVDTETGELIPAVLNTDERAALADNEARIERGLKVFYEVGAALLDIRDKRLYRETHKTFEDYCQQRWGMTPQHAGRLITAADITKNLEPIGSIPANEGQARPLAPLSPEEQRAVWDVVRKTAPDGKVTAGHVKSVVSVYWQTGDKWEWRVPAIIGLTVRGVIDRLLLHYQLGCYLKRDDAA